MCKQGRMDQEASISPDLTATVFGYPEHQASRVGNQVLIAVRELSRYLPLENLDGITIGANYPEALEAVDRGASSGPSVAPTSDQDVGEGTAMTFPVTCEGTLKSHVVLGPLIVSLLQAGENTDAFFTAIAVVAHELGHATEIEYKSRAFGHDLLSNIDELIPDPVGRYLWGLSHFTWEEYCANRIAATLLQISGDQENELFLVACKTYRDRIQAARIAYHQGHRPLDEFLGVVRHNVRLALLSTAYLLGLNDALDGEPSPAVEATARLHSPECQELRAFREPLRRIWDRRGEWDNYEELLSLNEPMLSLLHSLELYPTKGDPSGVYMKVPVRL